MYLFFSIHSKPKNFFDSTCLISQCLNGKLTASSPSSLLLIVTTFEQLLQKHIMTSQKTFNLSSKPGCFALNYSEWNCRKLFLFFVRVFAEYKDIKSNIWITTTSTCSSQFIYNKFICSRMNAPTCRFWPLYIKKLLIMWDYCNWVSETQKSFFKVCSTLP